MHDGGTSEVGGGASPARPGPPPPSAAFEIVIAAAPGVPAGHWLHAVVGAENVRQVRGSVRVTIADQAAMIGVLNGLHDLGLVIDHVHRLAAPADAAQHTP